jgi:hypothetical protein
LRKLWVCLIYVLGEQIMLQNYSGRDYSDGSMFQGTFKVRICCRLEFLKVFFLFSSLSH